jgi:hypothetical protein
MLLVLRLARVKQCASWILASHQSMMSALALCEFLGKMSLHSCRQVVKVSALGACQSLHTLDLFGTNVRHASGSLRAMCCKHLGSFIHARVMCLHLSPITLNLARSHVRVVSPQVFLQALEMLNMSCCRVSDVGLVSITPRTEPYGCQGQ